MLTVECLNCSHKQNIEKKDIFTDINGDFVVCKRCEGSFDVDFSVNNNEEINKNETV